MKTKDDLKKLTLSPSSINTYYQCPRKWYFTYVLGIKEAPSAAMLRGTVVHECIEDLFRATKYVNAKTFVKKTLPKKWKKYHLKLETKEDEIFYQETEEMLKMFGMKHDQKVKIASLSPKVNGKSHAWNLIKPKFREIRAKSETHNIRGIIDSVEIGKFDGRVFLVDYKTSNIYKHGISEEYLRQVKLYALMYKDMEKKNPDYLVINYVKYGENFIIPFKKDMFKQAEIAIDFVRRNTQSTKIDDYPCSDHKWCAYHDHEIEDIPKELKLFALPDGKQKKLTEV